MNCPYYRPSWEGTSDPSSTHFPLFTIHYSPLMLITFDGSQATNQYLSPPTSHLILSHPSIVDQLLLAECDEKPYENYRTGQTQGDGRSLLGGIRLKGDNWKKDVWECNFFAVAAQVALFEQLVQAQQDNVATVTLVDRWVTGIVVAKLVWLQVDRQYLTVVATGSWYRLQFQAVEV
jgi:hypothetical protein